MKVAQLKMLLDGVSEDANVVFQANEPGEEDGPGEATYTFAIGNVFSAFARGDEFVIDGAVTERE